MDFGIAGVPMIQQSVNPLIRFCSFSGYDFFDKILENRQRKLIYLPCALGMPLDAEEAMLVEIFIL
jgi:hypothetical protein